MVAIPRTIVECALDPSRVIPDDEFLRLNTPFLPHGHEEIGAVNGLRARTGRHQPMPYSLAIAVFASLFLCTITVIIISPVIFSSVSNTLFVGVFWVHTLVVAACASNRPTPSPTD